MKAKDKEDVIDFYIEKIWLPGMPYAEELIDKDLRKLKNTICFAGWIWQRTYNVFLNEVKNSIIFRYVFSIVKLIIKRKEK